MDKIILNGNHNIVIDIKQDLDIDNLTRTHFDFNLQMDLDLYSGGAGVCGDDALWFPLDELTGVKLVKLNNDYENLSKTLDYIMEVNSDIFPEVHWYEKIGDFLVIFMEHIFDTGYSVNNIYGNKFNYLPEEDSDFIFNDLNIDVAGREKCVIDFYKHDILPEDEWYKTDMNLISGKVVDFHRFKKFKNRYKFSSNGIGSAEMHGIYTNSLSRYSNVLDVNGLPKWKGKIYQGFIFDNGYEMTGYNSPNISNYIPYDSYLKMSFVPFNKVKNKKVLDLGCNEGFLCYQSIIHGASEAIGVDLQEEDIALAKDLNKNIFKFDNVKFEVGDAVEYIKNTNEKFGMVFLSSVLHQIYKDMHDSEEFLNEIKKKSDYLFYETPVDHPLMDISLKKIKNVLENTFNSVRLLYVYDAYSSGYRAIFICYS
jgi:16S rRNA G966 N2-methylase RsmD|tara:strand:- start:3482 stop:4753 length:1272 start_codon:yes stop_codon:yes gene_type:complete